MTSKLFICLRGEFVRSNNEQRKVRQLVVTNGMLPDAELMGWGKRRPASQLEEKTMSADITDTTDTINISSVVRCRVPALWARTV